MLVFALFLGILVIVGFNAWVSVHVLRAQYFESSQKAAQFILIWTIPLAGAAVVTWVMMNEAVSRSSSADPLRTPETQGAVTWGDFSENHHGDNGNHGI